MLITESLKPETILLMDRVENAETAIKLISERLSRHLGMDCTQIERAIVNRERARTTALTNGAAIPHCRMPGMRQFCCALAVLQTSVRWDNEGHAVDTILMIAGPAENVSDHLRILANGSQILDSPALRAKLRRAPDARQAHALIASAEQAIERRRQDGGVLRELRGTRDARAHDDLAAVADCFEW